MSTQPDTDKSSPARDIAVLVKDGRMFAAYLSGLENWKDDGAFVACICDALEVAQAEIQKLTGPGLARKAAALEKLEAILRASEGTELRLHIIGAFTEIADPYACPACLASEDSLLTAIEALPEAITPEETPAT